MYCADQQQNYIESALMSGPQHITVNERLLDIIRRRSVVDYNSFISCLSITGQQHLGSLLDAGGGLAFFSHNTSTTYSVYSMVSPVSQKSLKLIEFSKFVYKFVKIIFDILIATSQTISGEFLTPFFTYFCSLHVLICLCFKLFMVPYFPPEKVAQSARPQTTFCEA